MEQNIVMNCDNMEYMRGLSDGQFDLAICDPPYGIGKDWKKRKNNKHFKDTSYDNKKLSADYFAEVKRVAKNWMFFGWNYYTEILGSTNYLLIWDKMASNNNKVRFSKCEIACTNIKIPCNIVHIEWEGYRMGSERGTHKIHPHQKPVALYRWILREYAQKGWTIFDPNVGSGSSRIAADIEGFEFFGCEIDPLYFTMQQKRYDNFKNQLKLL